MSWDGSLLLPLQIHESHFTSYSSVPEADSWKFLLDSFTLWLPVEFSQWKMPVASGKRKESGVPSRKNIYKGLFLERREKRNYIVGMKNQREFSLDEAESGKGQ